MTPTDWPERSARIGTGSTQPSFQAVSLINFSTPPIVPAPCPQHPPPHSPPPSPPRGPIRPAPPGLAAVLSDASTAPPNRPTAHTLAHPAKLLPTRQPEARPPGPP